MASCVEMRGLTKAYGTTVAVRDLSLEIPSGSVTGLLGPNGAGKSTTICMLAGLVHPTSGSINVFGKSLRKNFLETIAKTGVVVENQAFYNHMSVRQNLQFTAALARRNVTVDRLLDLVGLLPAADTRAGEISFGMSRRLALAQALLADPALLLLDEPTLGLDVESTQDVLNLLRHMAREGGVTILYSTHMLHEVETLCDRVAVLNRGELLTCERTDALLSYDSTQVEVLIDTPDAAAKRLKELDWIERTRVVPGRLDVRLKDGSIPKLTAFLVSAGYDVKGVIPRRRTLREYFLEILNR